MEEAEAKVVFTKLDGNGYCLPDLGLIVVNQDLDINRRKYVIMHELAHIHQSSELYQATKQAQIKLEYEANTIMVQAMLRDYDEINGHKPFNYVDFMEQTGLNGYYEHVVAELI